MNSPLLLAGIVGVAVALSAVIPMWWGVRTEKRLFRALETVVALRKELSAAQGERQEAEAALANSMLEAGKWQRLYLLSESERDTPIDQRKTRVWNT